jgi:LuxR family transcriptional regulator, maltose regulon positive regulatory protein
MSSPILSTKLYTPPPRPNLVLRPRLIERLKEGKLRKLILLSAPAGFGKTTLVSEWVVECEQKVAWFSLDEGDNEPSRFLMYMVAALQTIFPKIGQGIIVALQSPQPPSTESMLTILLNEIAANSDHIFLVLDDYHVIDSEPIDQALTFLLDHLPPQLSLVITTREDPSLPLSRYRVRGQLIELRASDLRFTPEETGAFLNEMMGLNLSVENIIALEVRTEGWIAGLQLAALSMQGREDTLSFIQAFTGSHRFVLDYLIEEVLQHQSEKIRSFLLQTTILDKFCAPLCNAVTEREDSKEMLDVLERNNLFIIPLDDQRHWYRYHHLFGDVLLAHLEESKPDQLSLLHQRASRWYEQNGSLPDAISHALAAEDFECAAGLIERAFPATEDKSIQPIEWIGWVKKLPDEMVHIRPVLNVGYAYLLLGFGEFETAEARLKDAESLLQESENKVVVVDQEQYKSLPATIAIGRAYIAQTFGNITDTVRYARRALEYPEANPYRHSQAYMMLGMTYWASGDLESAGKVFADYTLKLRNAGNIPDAISSTIVLADILLALGRLHEAIETIEQLLKYLLDRGEPISSDAADLYRELSELYLEQFDLEGSVQQLLKSKELGEKAELPVWRYRWCIAQSRLHEAQGDLGRALEFLDDAQRLYIRTPLPDMSPISAMKARIWVAQGRLNKALEWEHQQEHSVDDNLSFMREFEHITLTRILIAQYQKDRCEDTIHSAIVLLTRLLEAGEGSGRMGSVIEILMLQALALLAQGSIPAALAPLARALSLAEPEDYIRIFVVEGNPMAELLKRLDRKDGTITEKQYISKLLSAINHPSGIASYEKKQVVSPQTMLEPLSKRELEVLRLLKSDLLGPEIARELTVSLNTLRTHTQNIYAKLGVNDRRAAARRAEELNLL